MYHDLYNPKRTPQSQPVPGEDMQPNAAGGYAYAISKWDRLDRFLIMGTMAGTYYIQPREFTADMVEVLNSCLEEDHKRYIQRVVEVSERGLALKNSHALFALAVAAAYAIGPQGDSVFFGDERKMALSGLKRVARIPTHLFEFLDYVPV